MTANTLAVIRATIAFANPFRVGTGIAGDGLDERIDRLDPLPASSIKGVMRQEARILLGAADSAGPNDDPELIRQVFGTPWLPCPWHWSVTVAELIPTVRVNVRLDDGGMVVPGALMVKEEATLTSASLTITQVGPLDGDADQHRALLRVSAGMVEKIGQKRTRGMGWAQIAVQQPGWKADLEHLKTARMHQSGGVA